MTLLTIGGAPALAWADEDDPPPPRTAPLPPQADLDGGYLFLGPSGGAVAIEGEWDSLVGAQLTWLRVREHRALAAAGLSLHGARYAARDGGRVALEAVAGTRRLGGVLIGVAAGPAVELAELAHPRVGATGALWVFAGVEPYARVGAFADSGAFVELGVSISLPAFRW